MIGMEGTVYTVTIVNYDPEYSPWTSSFTTRKAAEEFKRKAEEKLEKYGVDGVKVVIDSGAIDDTMYLDWIDSAYGDEEEE